MKWTNTLLSALLLCSCADQPGDPSELTQDPESPGEGEWGQVVVSTPRGPQTLDYQVQGGRAIFEEDIDLGSAAELAVRGKLRAAPTILVGYRWTNGVVRYTFGSMNETRRNRVRAVMRELDAELPITMVEITSRTGNYIEFADADSSQLSPGHSDALGMAGGEQHITIKYNPDGPEPGTIKHEFLHALGFYHEQGRWDRNYFITVDYSCIDEDLAGNYNPHYDTYDDLPYDYRSIMHYGPESGCVKGGDGKCIANCPTMTDAFTGASDTFGSTGDLSADDVNAIYLMYGESHLINEWDDRLGSAIVIADFDKDGYKDVAVSAPLENVGGKGSAGMVRIFKGTAVSLVPWQTLTQDDVPGAAVEVSDRFGDALAVGDYDDDGTYDLLVGAPLEDVGSVVDAGAVFLFRGGPNGLVGDRYLTQSGTSVSSEESSDRFGSALAVGHFTKTGHAEVAVGAPGERVGSVRPGAVFVYHLDATQYHNPTKLTQSGLGVLQTNDSFGETLAQRDLDGDGFADLVVGAPELMSDGTGAVYVFKGVTPANSASTAFWGPMLLGVTEVRPPNGAPRDRFGKSIALGNFNGNFGIDLAVGAPSRASGRGHVYVWYGTYGLLRPGFYGNLQELGQAPLSTEAANDWFGYALAAGAFVGTKDGTQDLAIGVPGKVSNSGQVMIYEGGSAYLAARENINQNRFYQAALEGGDRFGEALASENIDGNGRSYLGVDPRDNSRAFADLVVGSPGEANGNDAAAGGIYTMLGSEPALTPDSFYDQESSPGY